MLGRPVFNCFLAAVAVLFIATAPANSHMAFKKALEKKYPNMTIKCEACHVKSKPKTERGEFGKLFYKELESLKLTDGFKSKKGAERKKYEQEVMTPAFLKALEVIKEKENDGGEKYGALIESGKIPNIALKSEQGKDEQEDSEDSEQDDSDGSDDDGDG